MFTRSEEKEIKNLIELILQKIDKLDKLDAIETRCINIEKSLDSLIYSNTKLLKKLDKRISILNTETSQINEKVKH
ncbi:MAG TPA: hypothetical protein PKU95_04290 [Candidatus Dojkabacteria bacterium]|nr:hypothetical protein [Candidatus Dojkabacteria bacterium]